MFVLFLVYGSMIIMNLLVAITVNRTSVADGVSILLASRIEDMSGMNQMSNSLFAWVKAKEKGPLENIPLKVSDFLLYKIIVHFYR